MYFLTIQYFFLNKWYFLKLKHKNLHYFGRTFKYMMWLDEQVVHNFMAFNNLILCKFYYFICGFFFKLSYFPRSFNVLHPARTLNVKQQ